MEIQDLVMQGQIGIASFDLFNGQLDQYRGDTNSADYLTTPFVLMEFVGGDWRHDGQSRIADEYFFRLYYVCEDYRETNNYSAQQASAVEHLDKISELANLLDLQNTTYIQGIQFVREEIDTSYTHIIGHVLDFVGLVVDDSLKTHNPPDTTIVTTSETQAFKFTP
jgi:hypothetical protein